MRALALTLFIAGLPTTILGQTPAPGTPRAPGVGDTRRDVAIGCLSREGTAAAPRYLLTDTRGERPTVYRLDGDRAALDAHVGHLVEASGSLAPAPTTARGTAAVPTLKVNSLVWISTSCRK